MGQASVENAHVPCINWGIVGEVSVVFGWQLQVYYVHILNRV